MEKARRRTGDGKATVRDPTVEQFIYYLCSVEGDSQQWHQARCRAFRMELNSLAAHLGDISGHPVEWRDDAYEAADPYVSQLLATIDWTLSPDGRRACHAEARTYGDAYWLHVRYYRSGTCPANVHAIMRREDVWMPWQEEQLLGQSFCLAGIAHLKEGHALAAQALRRQMLPRKGIGDLQTCGLDQARIYRGSQHPDLSVFLYAPEKADWAANTFLDDWMPRWHFHRHKLDRELAWCEGISPSLEEQATRLRETTQHEPEEFEGWLERYASYVGQLATCLRREKAVESDLESLEWLLSQLAVEVPDTYFATSLRALRARRQKLAAGLVRWQRLRDEIAQAMPEAGSLSASPPLRGDLSRIWLNSQQPTPVLADLASARQLPAWPGSGWVPASAIHFPDDCHSIPDWSARRYDTFHFAIAGPRENGSYGIVMTSSVLGERRGTFSLNDDAPELQAALTAAAAEGTSPKDLGESLFQSLMDSERGDMYNQALALARATSRGLCWRLSIAEAPELDALPWEYLYDEQAEAYLAASAETPFARCVGDTVPVPPRPLEGPLRILLAVADPQDAEDRYGLAPAQAEREVVAMGKTLRPLQEAGLLKLEIVTHASPAAVCQASASFHPHVLHLVGHGVVRRGAGHILLENETHQGRLANVRTLRELFLGGGQTRLTILCPPDGIPGGPARSPAGLAPDHRLGSVMEGSAQALVDLARCLQRSGPYAALAFQHPLPAKWRRRFLYEFSRALVLGNAVDVALAEARRRLLRALDGERAIWGWPMLLLPSMSGQLFSPKG